MRGKREAEEARRRLEERADRSVSEERAEKEMERGRIRPSGEGGITEGKPMRSCFRSFIDSPSASSCFASRETGY